MQLSLPPASRIRTRFLGSADRRLATMQPAVPAPMTIKSKSPSRRFITPSIFGFFYAIALHGPPVQGAVGRGVAAVLQKHSRLNQETETTHAHREPRRRSAARYPGLAPRHPPASRAAL